MERIQTTNLKKHKCQGSTLKGTQCKNRCTVGYKDEYYCHAHIPKDLSEKLQEQKASDEASSISLYNEINESIEKKIKEIHERLSLMRKVPPPEEMAHSLLWDLQNGACFMCTAMGKNGNKTQELVQDHCHDTGLVRALLCSSCNTQEGFAKPENRAWAAYRNFYPAKGWYYRYQEQQAWKTVDDFLDYRVRKEEVLRIYEEEIGLNLDNKKSMSHFELAKHVNTISCIDTYMKIASKIDKTKRDEFIDVRYLLGYSLGKGILEMFSKDEIENNEIIEDIVLILGLTIQTIKPLVDKLKNCIVLNYNYRKKIMHVVGSTHTGNILLDDATRPTRTKLEYRMARLGLLALAVSYPSVSKIIGIKVDITDFGMDVVKNALENIGRISYQEWSNIEKLHSLPSDHTEYVSRLLSFLSDYESKYNLIDYITREAQK